MKLEVGKTYRARDGQKAFVVRSMMGAYYVRFEGNESVHLYHKNGRYLRETEVSDDLVAEWED